MCISLLPRELRSSSNINYEDNAEWVETACRVRVGLSHISPHVRSDFSSHSYISPHLMSLTHRTAMGADPDRIVLKKIVLTGYPRKCKKRGAIVKYMFFNPEDILWFKPVELRTKHGMSGNIRQSVGLHGSMKCVFSDSVHQHDTVCMNLYKRIYPKHPGSPSKGDIAKTLNDQAGGFSASSSALSFAADFQSRKF